MDYTLNDLVNFIEAQRQLIVHSATELAEADAPLQVVDKEFEYANYLRDIILRIKYIQENGNEN